MTNKITQIDTNDGVLFMSARRVFTPFGLNRLSPLNFAQYARFYPYPSASVKIYESRIELSANSITFGRKLEGSYHCMDIGEIKFIHNGDEKLAMEMTK